MTQNVSDPKLLHLVRKLVVTTPTIIISTSDYEMNEKCDEIVATLRTQHREYQRKDSQMLKASVEAAIRQIAQSSTPSRSKRKQQQQQEEEYEAAARAHEAAVGSGGLNLGLRNSYKLQQKQQQRESTLQTVAELLDPQEGKLNQIKRSTSRTSVTEENSIVDGALHTQNDHRVIVVAERRPSPTTSNNNNNYGEKSTSKALPRNNKKLKRSISRRSSLGEVGAPAPSLVPNAAKSILEPAPRPSERYSDLGGMAEIIQEVRQLVEYPLTRPELYRHLGVDPPRGVLLRGPPGTGKTHLANAIAGQLGVPYFCVSAPELVSSMSGDSEGRIRELFQAASDLAPSIIFLDEIDAVAPKRSEASGARGMEKRMVAQLLTSMDQVKPSNNREQNAVLILAATNRPDALDPALRRAGRFDREIFLGVPDEEAREKILRAMTKDMRLAGREDENQFDYKILARKTPGFVGADIKSLAKEAAVVAINRIFRDVLKENCTRDSPSVPRTNENCTIHDEPGAVGSLTPLTKEQMEPLYVTMDDFLTAIPLVQPSSKREGFATVPDVTWENVGALEGIREELSLSVLEPIRSPEKFQALGLPLPAGVLLYGPPGCGKTLLAKAVANESGANFISVKGPELLDKYVGESEKAVRVVFDRARSSSPCIVFFDELDSLVPRRGSDNGGGGGVSERVVNQLLTEMDGLESRRSVFVIAATNRPELIDPAMMRPGRLDKLLYVPLPTALERVSILKTLALKVTQGNDVDLVSIGMSPRAEGYSGADCAALLREAGLAVLKEDALATSEGKSPNSVDLRIMAKHFEVAFASVLPSVSKKDQSRYDRIRDRMAHARSRGIGITTDVEEENAVNAKAENVDDKKST